MLKTVKTKEASWTHRTNNSTIPNKKSKRNWKMLRTTNTKSTSQLGISHPHNTTPGKTGRDAEKRMSLGEKNSSMGNRNPIRKEASLEGQSSTRRASKEGGGKKTHSPETRSIKMNSRTPEKKYFPNNQHSYTAMLILCNNNLVCNNVNLWTIFVCRIFFCLLWTLYAWTYQKFSSNYVRNSAKDFSPPPARLISRHKLVSSSLHHHHANPIRLGTSRSGERASERGN